MAEASNIDQSGGITSSENTPGKNGSGLCTKAPTRTMKRPRDDKEETTDSPDDSEPEEKRGSFRLNPPTLIHGQAKPAPKEEETQETGQKRNFLRPSILSAPATPSLTVTSTASEPVNGKSAPSITQVPILGTGLLLPGRVPSNNPFLRTNEEEEEKEPKQDFLFQSTIEQRNKENGGEAEATGADQYAKANGAAENTFLQMSNQQPASSTTNDDDKLKTGSSGFVFGSKMEERVMKNEADSTSGAAASQVSDTKDASEFLFGKNLSDRVKVSGADSTHNSTLPTAPAESVIFHDPTLSTSDGVSSSSSGRKLEEDAAALFAASNKKPVMPEVELKTGEEDEKNVLQTQCKLFQYDSTSKSWVERGRGNLRLNDKRVSTQKFDSRLVMRTHGSLRLILNTKIWATMVVDKASQKSVRISAQNEDGAIGMYLIQAAMNDAEQIYRAVEYRVLHLKQIMEREEAVKKATESASQKDEQEVSSSESDQTKTKESEESSDKQEAQVSSSDAVVESDANTTTTTGEDKPAETTSSSAEADSGCASGDNKTPATTEQSQPDETANEPSSTENTTKQQLECKTQSKAIESTTGERN